MAAKSQNEEDSLRRTKRARSRRTRSRLTKGQRIVALKRYARAAASVELTWLPIVAFAPGAAIREAFRIWWGPYQMGEDFDRLCGRRLRFGPRKNRTVTLTREVVSGAHLEYDARYPEAKKIQQKWLRRMRRVFPKDGPVKLSKPRVTMASPTRGRCPVKVKIKLDYPLHQPETWLVTLDRRYPGEIFGLLHDFYRTLYTADEAKGGKDGPVRGGTFLNRGSGPLIWGHDIGDLVIESVQYRATPKDKDGAEGVFTFGIGS